MMSARACALLTRWVRMKATLAERAPCCRIVCWTETHWRSQMCKYTAYVWFQCIRGYQARIKVAKCQFLPWQWVVDGEATRSIIHFHFFFFFSFPVTKESRRP